MTEGPRAPLRTLHAELVCKPMEVLRVSVPAFLYTMQSNLLFVALSNMDPAFFQVAYQLKILTTAVFSVTMLGRRISTGQWMALLLLTLGCVLVTDLRGSKPHAKESAKESGSRLAGLFAVGAAALLSSSSSVYFEKMLKKRAGAVQLQARCSSDPIGENR